MAPRRTPNVRHHGRNDTGKALSRWGVFVRWSTDLGLDLQPSYSCKTPEVWCPQYAQFARNVSQALSDKSLEPLLELRRAFDVANNTKNSDRQAMSMLLSSACIAYDNELASLLLTTDTPVLHASLIARQWGGRPNAVALETFFLALQAQPAANARQHKRPAPPARSARQGTETSPTFELERNRSRAARLAAALFRACLGSTHTDGQLTVTLDMLLKVDAVDKSALESAACAACQSLDWMVWRCLCRHSVRWQEMFLQALLSPIQGALHPAMFSPGVHDVVVSLLSRDASHFHAFPDLRAAMEHRPHRLSSVAMTIARGLPRSHIVNSSLPRTLVLTQLPRAAHGVSLLPSLPILVHNERRPDSPNASHDLCSSPSRIPTLAAASRGAYLRILAREWLLSDNEAQFTLSLTNFVSSIVAKLPADVQQVVCSADLLLPCMIEAAAARQRDILPHVRSGHTARVVCGLCPHYNRRGYCRYGSCADEVLHEDVAQ